MILSFHAALAEAATPYGIESFDDVLEPLWRGIRSLRGKVLASFLKAIGHIIPLMDAEHAFYYTREVRSTGSECTAKRCLLHASDWRSRLGKPFMGTNLNICNLV